MESDDGPTTMKAIVITRFGGPEVLELRDVPQPVPAGGEVLVNVQAAGVNFADIMTAQRSYPGTPPAPLVAGREFAGTIVGTGERVMGYAQWGAFAEFIACRRELLWPSCGTTFSWPTSRTGCSTLTRAPTG